MDQYEGRSLPSNFPTVNCCIAGTVCILAQDSQQGQEAVERIRAKYHQQTGYRPAVFVGSSEGALKQSMIRARAVSPV